MSLWRLAYLLSAELYLGIVWGVVWSVYARSLVNSGLEGGYYGLAGLALSIAFSLSTLLAGLSYDRGLRFPVALGSGFTLIIGLAALRSSGLALISPVILGLSLGFHSVASIYTISSCKCFKAAAFTLAYSSSLLGVSIGAMLVALGLNFEGPRAYIIVSASPIILALYPLLSEGGGGGSVKPYFRGFHVIVYPTLLAVILGFSMGASIYNMDYYVVVVFKVDERVVGLMYSYAYMFAAITVALVALKLKGDINTVSGHIYAIIIQAVMLILMASSKDLTPLILIYTIRSAFGILAESLFDATYTRIIPESIRGLTISSVIIAYELSSGAGKLAGSILADGSLWKPLTASSLIMLTYTLIAPGIFKAMEASAREREKRKDRGGGNKHDEARRMRGSHINPMIGGWELVGYRERVTTLIAPPPGPCQRG